MRQRGAIAIGYVLALGGAGPLAATEADPAADRTIVAALEITDQAAGHVAAD